MLWWLLASLAAALGCLVGARYIDAPIWLDLLWGTLAAASLAVAFAIALALRRIATERWHAPAALILALGAAIGRVGALTLLLRAPERQPNIDVSKMALAASSIAWSALALLWGVLAVADALERPADDPLPKARLAASALAVTLALFCVAPLWRLLGLSINATTVVGLFGLAAVAYGAAVLYRRLRAAFRKHMK
ncbi:MAG: hypothetical protein CSA24_01785 [Deltaproteobacteria bacterium]|nr:MAG: hypothetical protein CSA24_01785 [Deltaproteobacteria bacterium]